MTLSKKECIPCKGGVPPLKGEELEQLNAEAALLEEQIVENVAGLLESG